MKVKKILCSGMAVLLMMGNIPPSLAFAQNNENSIVETAQGFSVNGSGEETVQEIQEEPVQEEDSVQEEKDRSEGAEQEGWPGDEAAQENLQEEQQEEGVLSENTQEEPKGQENEEIFLDENAGGMNEEATVGAEEAAQAAESDFEYDVEVDENGNEYDAVAITGYKGTDTALKIPDRLGGKKVTRIGDAVFKSHEELISVELPDGVTEIGRWAFGYCSRLEEVHLPSGLTNINYAAFYGCGSLKEIHLPSGLISIGDYAFEDCSSLKELQLPDGLRGINYAAFSGCSSLKEIHLPSNLSYIEGYAFEGCSSLKKIELPDNVDEIEIYVFKDCSSLVQIIVGEANEYYQSIDGILYDKAITDLVVCPGGKRGTVALPDSVTKISSGAFYGCSGLKEIHLPSGVKDIRNSAFSGCSGLKEIHLPDGVTSIGASAFKNCSGLEEIHLPDSVTDISQYASNIFSGCRSLKEVRLPSALTRIPERMFQDCSSLRKIELSSIVTEIGTGAFGSCTSLNEIAVDRDNPNYRSVDGILYNKEGTELIAYPAGKKGTAVLPGGVTSINSYAFLGCRGLGKIYLPDSVTEIESYVFQDCSGLKEVRLPSGLTRIPGFMFYGCSGLEKFHLPDGVTTIGSCAFLDCSGLKELYLPDSVTSIEDGQRWTGVVDYVVIPAFEGCDKLTMIVGEGSYAEKYAKEHNIPYRYKATTAAEQAAKKALNAVKASRSSITLYTGKVSHTAAIKPVYPKNFTASLKAVGLKVKSVNYTSSQSKNVSVTQKGVATGLKAGSATVTMTVTLNDGSEKILQTKVTVKKPYLKVSGKRSVKKGKNLTLKVQKYGEKGTALWSVDKPKIAKINAKTGKLTAKAVGTVKVTVKVGNLKKTYIVAIKK